MMGSDHQTPVAGGRPIPKRTLYPIAGFFMGIGAPVGCLIYRYLAHQGGDPGLMAFAGVEVSTHLFFYGYMAIGTVAAFVLSGFLIGIRDDRLEEKNRKLEQANTELRKLDHLKTDFINTVSHELRTPLTSMRFAAEILPEQLRRGITEDTLRLAQIIQEDNDRLTMLVEDLLDFSRIEAGRLKLELETTQLPDLVSAALEGMRPLAERKGIQMAIARPGDLPPVLVDPQRIGQVMTNLLSNAIKFTAEGGQVRVVMKGQQGVGRKAEREKELSPPLPVGVRGAGRPSAWVEVEVHDTGIGIPADDLPKIFDRFYRVRDKTKTYVEGTGLGLAIVKGIVEAHGGKVWAESIIGVGSTFHFIVPVAETVTLKTLRTH